MSQYLASLRAANHSSGKCNKLSCNGPCEFIKLVAGKQPSLLMAGNNDEVYDKKSQRYAKDNRTTFNRTQ